MIETWMIVLWMIVSYPDGVDGRRGLHSKVTEEVVEDVVESEVIVGAVGSSGSSSSGTYFTAADTEEVKEL